MSPAKPERNARRPNTAPAYYLGHPAAVWITAMRPRRRPTASGYLPEAAVSSGHPTRDSGVLQRSSTPQSSVRANGSLPDHE